MNQAITLTNSSLLSWGLFYRVASLYFRELFNVGFCSFYALIINLTTTIFQSNCQPNSTPTTNPTARTNKSHNGQQTQLGGLPTYRGQRQHPSRRYPRPKDPVRPLLPNPDCRVQHTSNDSRSAETCYPVRRFPSRADGSVPTHGLVQGQPGPKRSRRSRGLYPSRHDQLSQGP